MDEVTPLEHYQAAQQAADDGEYDVAMEHLAECDQQDPEGYRMLTTRLRHEIATLREVPTSAGTSSSTSESKPDSSGFSLQATESSLPSPVQETDNPFSKGQVQSPAQSYTATSADGSIQEIGTSQQSQQVSSESTQEQADPDTANTGEHRSADEFIAAAHVAYTAGEYDEADRLLDEADKADPSVAKSTSMARKAVAAARKG